MLSVPLRSVPPPRRSVKSYKAEGRHSSDQLNDTVWERHPELAGHVHGIIASLSSPGDCMTNVSRVSWLTVKHTMPMCPEVPISTSIDRVDTDDILVDPTTPAPPRTVTVELLLTHRQRHVQRLIGKAANMAWNRTVDEYRRHMITAAAMRQRNIEMKRQASNSNRKMHREIKQAVTRHKRVVDVLTRQYRKHKAGLERAQKRVTANTAKASKAKTQAARLRYEATIPADRRAMVELSGYMSEIKDKQRMAHRALKSDIRRAKAAAATRAKRIAKTKYVPPRLPYADIESRARMREGTLSEKERLLFFDILNRHLRNRTFLDRPTASMVKGVIAVLKAQVTKNSPHFVIRKRSRKSNIVATFNRRDFEMLTRSENLGPLFCRHDGGTVAMVIAPPSEFKIIFNRARRRWTMTYTEPLVVEQPPADRCGLGANDPGVAVFQTFVQMDTGEVHEIGTRDDLYKYVIPFNKKAEFHERAAHRASQARKAAYIAARPDERHGVLCDQKLRRVARNHKWHAQRLRTKVSNRIKDAHCSVAKYMCQRVETLCQPAFRVKAMTERGTSGKATRVEMLAWSHYKFKCHLISACQRYQTTLINTLEPYTSKSCVACHRFGSHDGRFFECDNESCVVDRFPRDWAGAINNAIVAVHV